MNKPEIDFAPTNTDELTAASKKIAETLLGRTLAPADPIYLLIKSFVAIVVNQRRLLDWSAKQNLLAFATGEHLDALGQLVGVERLPASNASCQVEVKLSTARNSTTVISKGSRVTADNKIFFALDDQLIFFSGETVKLATATCLTVGDAGNGFAAGELNRIVDPQPFLLSMTNTTTTDGGADLEDDEAFRERIHIAPESFSCAGPKGAYLARVKEVSASIDDVAVVSPSPGHVDIYLLTNTGQPSAQLINDVSDYLNRKEIRPLTDIVAVKAPTLTNYSIDATAFIDDLSNAAQIEADLTAAVEEFVSWQSSKLGRDLNPSKLLALLMNTGVKRVEIRQPTFRRLDDVSVARCTNRSLTLEVEDP